MKTILKPIRPAENFLHLDLTYHLLLFDRIHILCNNSRVTYGTDKIPP